MFMTHLWEIQMRQAYKIDKNVWNIYGTCYVYLGIKQISIEVPLLQFYQREGKFTYVLINIRNLPIVQFHPFQLTALLRENNR
jgi:hypothetical protein